MKLFNLDSPLMTALNKICDLIWLNVLALVCCIPIFTIGASMTAMHYVVLKMARGQEGYITKDFFKSFKVNFKQATIIWLIILALIVVLGLDFWILLTGGITEGANATLQTVVRAFVILSAVFLLDLIVFVFPVLSHFDNTIKGTIKNSFLMSMVVLPKTVIMILLQLVPWAILYFLPQILPIGLMFWMSGPAYLSALLYSKTFKKYEPEEMQEENNDDFTWTVGGSDESEEEEANA